MPKMEVYVTGLISLYYGLLGIKYHRALSAVAQLQHMSNQASLQVILKKLFQGTT
jgi:hypothetical protein